MALTDLQRALVADIQERDDPRLKWDEPWEQHGPGKLMHGGPPLRETGERMPCSGHRMMPPEGCPWCSHAR